MRPSQADETADSAGEEDDEADRRRKEGREALSRVVALAAEASRRPSPVHGVQLNVEPSEPSPIRSKFWAVGEETDESESDEPEEPRTPSTPEFIKAAIDAGFTTEQLYRAE